MKKKLDNSVNVSLNKLNDANRAFILQTLLHSRRTKVDCGEYTYSSKMKIEIKIGDFSLKIN